jgi:aryl-alcohol dehydrogenase
LPLDILGPLGCGIQTGAGAVLNTLAVEAGASIAIFGVGSVGLAALLAAAGVGCETIVAVDVQESRLRRAIDLGATHTIDSSKADAVTEILELTKGQGVEFSVDCVGLQATVRNALECLQTPGVCATVGFQGPQNEITIDQGNLLFGKTLVGVIEGDAIPGDFIPRMLDLHRAGRFPFEKFIDTFAFEKINDAIDAVYRGDVVKAVLTFD